jgi:hypothetical protein
MQLPPDSVIEERLVKTFPNNRLRELARATGLIQRDGGKLKADALFWSLAIGFLSGACPRNIGREIRFYGFRVHMT